MIVWYDLDVGLENTGKDVDSGLMYFNARWYDPETGRFITEDPARDSNLWYAYCNNNPMNFVDPTGLAPRNLTKEERKEYKKSIREADASKLNVKLACTGTAISLANDAMKAATGTESFYKSLTRNDGNENLSSILGTQPMASDFLPSDSDSSNNISYYTDSEGNRITDFNFDAIEEGTIGVFDTKNPIGEEGGPGGWSGHLITVTGVDTKNKTINFIEGHSSDISADPQTNISFSDFQAWVRGTGEFMGWGEIGSDSAMQINTNNTDPVSTPSQSSVRREEKK